MEPTSFLDQIDRLREQAERETDAVLKKEHQKTIRHLHKQYRRATKHRNSWFGFLRITLFFFIIFLLATWSFLHFTKNYGWWATLGVASLTAVVFSIITATMLRMLRFISEDIYKGVLDSALIALGKHKGDKNSSAENSPKEFPSSPATKCLEIPKQAVPHVTFETDPPALPQPQDEGE